MLSARAGRRIAESIRRATGRTALAADAEHLFPVLEATSPADVFADPFAEEGAERRPVLVVLERPLARRDGRGNRTAPRGDGAGARRTRGADLLRRRRGRGALRRDARHRHLRRGVPPGRPAGLTGQWEPSGFFAPCPNGSTCITATATAPTASPTTAEHSVLVSQPQHRCRGARTTPRRRARGGARRRTGRASRARRRRPAGCVRRPTASPRCRRSRARPAVAASPSPGRGRRGAGPRLRSARCSPTSSIFTMSATTP